MILPYIASFLFACSAYLLVTSSFAFASFVFRRIVSYVRNIAYFTRTNVYWPDLQSSKVSTYDYYYAWSRFNIKPNPIVIVTILIVSLVFGLVVGGVLVSIGIVCFTIGYYYLVISKANKNKKTLATQLPDALAALSASLKAGFSMTEAIKIVERETEKPLKQVFAAIARANTYNMTVSDAMKILALKLKLSEWDLVAETLYIQSKIGGNVIPVIESVSAVLRDKLKAEREIKTSTAAGKFSGIVVALLAPISFFVVYILAPDYIRPLYTTGIGETLLVLAAISEIIGFIWIIKILKVDF